MDKDVAHIYNRILLSHKKNEIMIFAATWMQLEIIILSEVSQKERQIPYISYMRDLSESHSIVSNSLRPHALYSPWTSPGQNTGTGSLPSPGDLPDPGNELGCPVLQVDSLPTELSGTQMNFYETETDPQTENRLVVAKGEGRVGEGRTESLRQADANYYTQNG